MSCSFPPTGCPSCTLSRKQPIAVFVTCALFMLSVSSCDAFSALDVKLRPSMHFRPNSRLSMSFLPEGWDSSRTANQRGDSNEANVASSISIPGFKQRLQDKFAPGLPKFPIVERITQSLRLIRPGLLRKRGEDFFVRQAIFFAAASTVDATIMALPHALPSWLLPIPSASLSMGLPLSVTALLAQSIAIDVTFSLWGCALEMMSSHDVDRLQRLETMIVLQDRQQMLHVKGDEILTPTTSNSNAPTQSNTRKEPSREANPNYFSPSINRQISSSISDGLVQPPKPAIVSAAAYARVSKEFALDGHGCEYGGDGTWRCS